MIGIFENIFQNGLSSDYDVVLQPDGTYRYLKNCQLVSQDGNNFVVKDCLGNLQTFTINAPYDVTTSFTGILPRIIGMISFVDKLIIFSTNNADTGGYLEIGVVNYLPYGQGIQPEAVSGQLNSGYIPLYHHVGLTVSQKYRFKGFSFVENELVERVYWTDNYNEPRVFNVSDPIFTTYISSGSIVSGTEYMVLEGAVRYNGVDYGPGLFFGNVFTGTATTTYTNLTGTSPSPKVVEYYPYELLDFTPSRVTPNTQFLSYGSGTVNCGSKVYFTRQATNNGVYTSWSYGTAPVPVGTQNETSAITSPPIPYHNFVGGGSSTELLNSGLSVNLLVEGADPNFPIIEVACAEFDYSPENPRQITIVYRGAVPSDGIIEHTGGVNLGDVSLSQLTLFPASILKCKTLATNKNYILAGNIVERDELDIDLSGANASVLYYPMNTHYDAASCTNSSMIYKGVSPTPDANPSAGSITPFSRWVVTVGVAIYNGANYGVGQTITGVTGAGNDSIDVTTTPGTQVRPCAIKNKYTNNAAARRENVLQLTGSSPTTTAMWDYKSAAMHTHLAGYWGGETYRFGIVFYDLKGNPYFARHLIDYTFPRTTESGIIRKDIIGNSGNYIYSLNSKLITISNILIPINIASQISGFSIMRAVRDGKVVTQGLVMQTNHTGASPDVYRSSSIIPVLYDANTVGDKTYAYLSPDLLCDADLPNSVGQVGDTMEIAAFVGAYDYSAGAAANGKRRARALSGTGGAIYSKLLEAVVPDSEAIPSIISYWADVNEGETADLGGGETLIPEITVGNNSSLIDRNTCSAVADYTLDAYNAIGSKKSIFKVETDLKYGSSSATDYSTSSNSGGALEITSRILANYTKSNFSNPYGGTGEDALANTLYISVGHYQPINAFVIADTQVGGNLVFDDVELGGGDCYVCLTDVSYGLWNNGYTNKYSYALSFPCECNSNYNLRRGRKTSNSTTYETGSTFANSILANGPGGEIRLESFDYNKGYSSQGQNVVYPSLPVDFVNSAQFRSRIRYAGEKVIGETTDSFRVFATLDFKDLSANYGSIMDINVKKDTVLVWQTLAISTVPIKERQLNTSPSGDQTTIGTGGVVDRWDVISSFFGTQHQWSISETEYGFIFFDMIKKAVVILSFDGEGLLEVSQVYGLKGFFDEAFLEIETNTTVNEDLLINSPTFAETSDRPTLGVGIISVYDPKLKMTYMTFKFFGHQDSEYKSKDFTIGYLHTKTKKCFVGFFDWCPYIMHNHNGYVLSLNDPKNNTQYLGITLTDKSFVVGETLWNTDKTREYVCIADVTLDNVAKYPEGANGDTYWTLVNSVNEIQVLNQPSSLTEATAPDYVYNMFDGKVVSNEIQFVVNPKIEKDMDFEVQNMIQNTSTNVNYTDIYISAGDQSASDLSISSTNRFYRFVRDKIFGVPPLATDGRITNKYLLVRMVKKNWGTNPTVLTKIVKILRSVTSSFNIKS